MDFEHHWHSLRNKLVKKYSCPNENICPVYSIIVISLRYVHISIYLLPNSQFHPEPLISNSLNSHHGALLKIPLTKLVLFEGAFLFALQTSCICILNTAPISNISAHAYPYAFTHTSVSANFFFSLSISLNVFQGSIPCATSPPPN